MDLHSVQHFYNNARKPLASTTLHNGNISPTTYESVTFIRKLMCRENAPGSHERKFCNEREYNKENSAKKFK
ncbi:hypothetical protein AGNV_050 [Anticarsia gemmatalis multiple nucleopolyhedrovirus]|uniref:Uncharacterized protein n=1 Tax=Anticarsia gemmatalis multiple nucleopolyhedrovirus TaxID=268591 RepID=A0A0S3IZT5_9ABAC|nr:hypothetical protein AGNV_050 [Anticarsia gemmatalis multiple nucleopolyhedrovirus]ALR70957.1 hypothetical protein AGNV_050 [Anticarsia gemmatalis multiple nucleopolyhedrovirus]ALR71586.1 hypothetical protein AGNV_050 [Anticarsia gemmatalis multiple nucleopolyhedrovirus]